MNIFLYDFLQELEDQYGLEEIIQNNMAKQGHYWHV